MSHVIVIGSGIAGLTTALRLAGRHEVTVVTKGCLGESNTALAQGGIAGVLSADDTVESHIADTLVAGAGLSCESAVRVLCTEGPERILDLAAAGVAFDRDENGYWARGLEGAHSVPRILHAGGDATGAAIVEALTNAVRVQVAAGTVRLLEHTVLVGLITSPAGSSSCDDADAGDAAGDAAGDCEVTGAELLRDASREILTADAVVLATGGAGQLYAHTTNPSAATGDGLATAIRAGAAVADTEFYQFHPTALAGSGFLISEAVRGAGALLLDAYGHRFMSEVDRRSELAPRDVVALAIHRRMALQGGGPCYLDARIVPEVSARFPTIARGLAEHGFDLAADLIPVTPAAHYFMGGISTDLDGRTSLPRLFAAGEVACTGVHGANRLASNSLLEGAVFGARVAVAIDADMVADAGVEPAAASTPATEAVGPTSSIVREELQALAWANLGVERSEQGLQTLLDRLGEGEHLRHLSEGDSADDSSPDVAAHPSDAATRRLVERIETANLVVIARSIASHALARKESRGAHTRTDFPAVTAASSAPLTRAPRPIPTDSLLQEAASC